MSGNKHVIAITTGCLVLAAGAVAGTTWYHGQDSPLAERKHAGNDVLDQIGLPATWKRTAALVRHDGSQLAWTRLYVAPVGETASLTELGRRLTRAGFEVGPAEWCYNATPCMAFSRDDYQVTVATSQPLGDDVAGLCAGACSELELLMYEPDSP